jgi:hypothetical protein
VLSPKQNGLELRNHQLRTKDHAVAPTTVYATASPVPSRRCWWITLRSDSTAGRGWSSSHATSTSAYSFLNGRTPRRCRVRSGQRAADESRRRRRREREQTLNAGSALNAVRGETGGGEVLIVLRCQGSHEDRGVRTQGSSARSARFISSAPASPLHAGRTSPTSGAVWSAAPSTWAAARCAWHRACGALAARRESGRPRTRRQVQ